MAEISLSNFLALVFSELSDTLAQTQQRSEIVSLTVQNLELDIPAHLRLESAPPSVSPSVAAARPTQLMISLPSTREALAPGKLGRLRLIIEPLLESREKPALRAPAED